MDSHSSHLNTANRPRSSQSPSPSHSASASATSSIRKYKLAAAAGAAAAVSEDHGPPASSFPPSSFSTDTRDGALTSNDDLESISARGGTDSDSNESEDAVVDDYEEDFDNDWTMQNFTAARLDNAGGGGGSGGGRNTKIKTEGSNVKMESSDGGKDGGATLSGVTGAGGIVGSGIAVKEEPVKIFSENIQASGAYSAREESLKKEEEEGRLKFVCVSNDGIDQHMVWLIGLKNIFARQLPNMSREYIVRLLMDRNHKSVIVIRRNQVVGGITFRPYARYIKDYDGGILMECKMDQKLPYIDLSTMIRRQRQLPSTDDQEIKRVLTEVLLKVTDGLFDEIATRVLREDDMVVEASTSPPPMPVSMASAKVLVPTIGKESESGGNSSSSLPGDVLGLGNYASDEEDDGGGTEIQSSRLPNSQDALQQSRIEKVSKYGRLPCIFRALQIKRTI